MLDLLAEICKLVCKRVERPIEQNHRLGDSIEDVVVDRQSSH